MRTLNIIAPLAYAILAQQVSALSDPCISLALKDSPLCNVTLSNEARASWLVEQLTPDEKWQLLSTFTGAGVERLG